MVGGHCIGVDPYYLTTKAEELGYHPEVILAGRRINEGVGPFIAQKMVKLLVQTERPIKKADVAILGITFKENVSDIRNSRVPSIVSELKQFGVNAHVHDPLADPSETMEEYGVQLVSEDEFPELDGVILAVAHEAYDQDVLSTFFAKLRSQGVLIDVKSVLSANQIPDGAQYWGV